MVKYDHPFIVVQILKLDPGDPQFIIQLAL